MAHSYQPHSYYSYPGHEMPTPQPPPLPHHSSYPVYTPSQSPFGHQDIYASEFGYEGEPKMNGTYRYLPDHGHNGTPPIMYSAASLRKKRSCADKLCCGCCTCFPRWLRSVCCILFLVVVVLAIVAGVLAALFKVPTVTFNGIQGEPEINLTGVSTVNFSFNLNITIENQNIESLTFDTIKATAFYPNYPNHALGGGEMSNVHIPSHAFTTIIFPFTLTADAKDPNMQRVLLDLLSKCGVYGGSASTIKINYDVVPTVRIAGIAISPTVSSSANIPCPVNEFSALSGIANLLPSDLANIQSNQV